MNLMPSVVIELLWRRPMDIAHPKVVYKVDNLQVQRENHDSLQFALIIILRTKHGGEGDIVLKRLTARILYIL